MIQHSQTPGGIRHHACMLVQAGAEGANRQMLGRWRPWARGKVKKTDCANTIFCNVFAISEAAPDFVKVSNNKSQGRKGTGKVQEGTDR